MSDLKEPCQCVFSLDAQYLHTKTRAADTQITLHSELYDSHHASHRARNACVFRNIGDVKTPILELGAVVNLG